MKRAPEGPAPLFWRRPKAASIMVDGKAANAAGGSAIPAAGGGATRNAAQVQVALAFDAHGAVCGGDDFSGGCAALTGIEAPVAILPVAGSGGGAEGNEGAAGSVP